MATNNQCRFAFAERQARLWDTDSAIVVAGETNAGKTTLINKIIGKNILTPNHLSNTGRVCRIRNSETKGLRLCTKDNRTIKEITIPKSSVLHQTLRQYTEKHSKEVPPGCHYVDVLLPLKLLKGDAIIVDTPGLNEEEKVRETLEEYLPNALSFIFVLNVGNDGGVQCDRIPKLFKLIRDKKKRGDLPCFEETEVLFLVNKWDTISIPDEVVDTDAEVDNDEIMDKNEKHRERTYKRIWNEVLDKIRNAWPFFTNKENAFQISLTAKGENPEFNRFLGRLNEMMEMIEYKRRKRFWALNNHCGITFAEGRTRLGTVYDGLIDIISKNEFEDDLKRELEIACPKYKVELKKRREDLRRPDSAIVIAGETNAGKTTLVNKIIGKNLLTSYHLSNTGLVCRIRNSERKGLRLCTKENEPLQDILIEKSSELYRELRKYTEKNSKDVPKECHYIDVLLPLKILKGDAIIVDTPGLNEEEKVRKMLEEYLPNALSFIFVLNVGNDGGVQCDRIPKLLKLIRDKKERGDLPCFDETEALFLVNKWDTIYIQDEVIDSDEDVDEEEIEQKNKENHEKEYKKIWDEVLYKIRNAWPFFTNKENAFQISLTAEGENPEFTRFLGRLSKMVEGNVNKRMKQHLCFLIEFAHNAERGIQARLKMFVLSESKYAEEIKSSEEKLNIMEATCKKLKKDFMTKIRRIVEEMSTDLSQHIKTETWKSEAFNPKGKKPIKDVAVKNLMSEIKTRVNETIDKWLSDSKFREKIATTEDEIRDQFQGMQITLANIEGDLSGNLSTSNADSNVPLVLGIVATSPLWVPFILLAGVLILAVVIILSPYLIFKAVVLGLENSKLELIDIIYNKYINQFDDRKILDILTKVAAPVNELTMKCFGTYFPSHVESLRETIKNLKSGKSQNYQKRDVFIRLNDTFSDVRVQLRNLRKDFYLD